MFSAPDWKVIGHSFMTFLNPLVLFGLLAAAIPILLHLLNLRKLRIIEFSTLSFLKELQKTRIRRIKIRQIILLILRTLIIILLVLAFSRPALKGSLIGGSGSHAKTTALLLLDNSLSMTARDNQGELLTQTRHLASSVLDLFNEGDEALVLPLSDVLSGNGNKSLIPGRDLNLLRNQVAALQPSAHFSLLEDGLRIAAKSISSSSNYNREVYIVSDFQSGVIPLLKSSAQKENLFPVETRFFLITLGNRTPRNLGVTALTIPSTIFEKEKPFTVKATITNATSEPVQTLAASVFLNGIRVAQQGVDIAAGQSSVAEFTIVPTATGALEGFIEIEDDDLLYDNRRSFTVMIPEKLQLLLIGRNPDLQYLRLAIETRQKTGRAAFEIREVSPDRLTPGHLNNTDVVLLTGIEEFPASLVSQCAQFVRNGGGMFLIPNERLQPQLFNATVAPLLNLPTITGIDGTPVATVQNQQQSYVEFSKVELDHPIFHGMYDEPTDNQPRRPNSPSSLRVLESPKILRSFRFAGTSSAFPLITMSNGSPFLIEQRLGSGTLLLMSVPATRAWSDLPLKGMFVPLLHRSISYLSQEQQAQHQLTVGDEVTMTLPPGAGRWSIRTPANNEILVQPVKSGDRQHLRFRETQEPGTYTLLQGTTVHQKFSVHLHTGETMTGKASREAIESLLDRLGIASSAVRTIDQKEELSERILESRFGTELWKECLLAALILALAEMLVARTTKKETVQLS